MASDFRSCIKFPYLVVANFLFLLASLPVSTNSVSFNFPSFDNNNPDIILQGDASISYSQIHLTHTISGSGRALYRTPIQLWDASSKKLAGFSTEFTFNTSTTSEISASYGDGFTFLLVPENKPLPANANNGSLGLYTVNKNNYSFAGNTQIVAVEFDTFQNIWDPTPLNHMGVDVNSIKSADYVPLAIGLMNKTGGQASITYYSAEKYLSVKLILYDGIFGYSSLLSSFVDLSSVLPERVQVGFSASTGDGVGLYNILSWSFNTTLEETAATKKGKGGLVAGIGVGIFLILISGIAIAWIRLRRKSPIEGNTEAGQFDTDEDFDKVAGPKRFAYSQLSKATNNFANEGKLGEGGFGGVYKGLLTGPGSREIAVKKIKSGSSQGKKEYIAEVKIISRLRHRNLVQLLGWCHDDGELLLVYEFMPNRSLDYHLFSRKLAFLPWSTRYKIALGLASSLLYLHEGWEQSVVHRDIKSSNVMLDLNFNPKLGDFGLARLVDHDAGLQTTVPAGTPGYLAPECLLSGKASKESDVYSFGIVALEIACGRKVIEVKEQANKVKLVEWVWDLYGKGLILEAVDNRLEGEFDEQQAKCLMVIGLWCAHPDVSYRPSMKQTIAALNWETPLPNLPPQLPVPIYVSPATNSSLLSSYQSSIVIEGNQTPTSSSSINSQSING